MLTLITIIVWRVIMLITYVKVESYRDTDTFMYQFLCVMVVMPVTYFGLVFIIMFAFLDGLLWWMF